MHILRASGLQKRFGSSAALAGVQFEIEVGEILVLLGPSGCGKTTTLRCVAGLESPDSGRIEIGGKAVFDDAARTNVPPEDRALGMVFQSYALWPHMTVYENVAFSLKVRKWPRSRIAQEVQQRLEMVELWSFKDRFPSALSGGQQQRVALARSLAGGPSLLLFDEPLSNLDARLRQQMRLELRELVKRAGTTALYVTHDQAEALAIADRVAVMSQGRIVEMGRPREIYASPSTHIAAGFLGTLNSLPPLLAQSIVGAAACQGCDWAVRAENIRLAQPGEADALPARVDSLEFVGETTIYKVDAAGAKLVVHSPHRFEVGGDVCVVIDREKLIKLDRKAAHEHH